MVPDPFMRRLGDLCDAIRLAHGWSVEELSRQIPVEMSSTSFRRLLDGQVRLSPAFVVKILKAIATILDLPWQNVWFYLCDEGGLSDPKLTEAACAKFLHLKRNSMRSVASFLYWRDHQTREIVSWRRYPPLSLLTESVRRVVINALVPGSGPRREAVVAVERRLGRVRRAYFLANGFGSASYLWLVFRSAFDAMHRLQPPFNCLRPTIHARSIMHEGIESIAHDAVEDRGVLIGFVEDHDPAFPAHLAGHFARFESVTSFDGNVVLQRVRGFPRAWYQTGGTAAEDRYVAEQSHRLTELRPWIKHQLTTEGVLQQLRPYLS